MNDKQLKIHEGLKYLGTDLEVFYQEGVNIYTSSSPLKAHFLAHCAREIDSMIRDTFSTDANKKAIEKKLKENKDDRKGLIASILACLGMERETVFAKKWHDISENFAKIAHRNGQSKEPRVAEEGMAIWDAYEDILYELIGNYYSLKRVIDNSFNFINLSVKNKGGDTQVHDIIDRLPFLFKIPSIKFYFFHNLESEIWLSPLFLKGFFKPDDIQSQFKVHNIINTPNWVEGQYLVKVAKTNLIKGDTEITEILNNIVNSYLLYTSSEGNPVYNSTADLYLSELVYLLPEDRLVENRISFIEKQLLVQNFLPDTVIREYLEVLLQNKSKNLLARTLLTLLTPIKTNSTEAEEDFFETEGYTYIESSHNYQSPIRDYNLHHLFNYISPINDLLDEQFINKLIDLITQFDPNLFDDYEIDKINYEEETNRYPGSAFKTLVQVTFAFLKNDLANIGSFIPQLLGTKLTILEKIFLELLNQDFTNLKDSFLANISTFLNKTELINNVKSVIDRQIGQFSAEEASHLVGQIDTMLLGNDWHREGLTFSQIQHFRATTILPLLKLFEHNYPEVVNNLIHKWSDQIPVPDVRYDSNTSFGELSDLPNFDMLPVEDIIKLLQEDTGNSYYENQIAYGFREDVEVNSSKYFTDLHYLLNILPIYKNALLSAVKAMSYANTFIYWNEILIYSKEVIKSIDFTQEDQVHYQFVKELSNLFIDKTANNDTAISEDLAPDLIQIFTFVLNSIEPELQNSTGLEYKIRETRYSCVLNALLMATLHWGRNKLKDQEDKFFPCVKETLEQLFESGESIEWHYILGARLSNIAYLDYNWYVKIIQQIFSQNKLFWYSSFSAYLTVNPHLPVLTYKRLIAEYNRAINEQDIISNTALASTIIEHAVMYYLHFKEQEEEESLLETIVQVHNLKLLRILVRYVVSRFQYSELPERDGKLRKIWESVYVSVAQLEDSEDKRYVLGSLGNWVGQIAALDQQAVDLLETSFENEMGLNTLIFFESLLLHVERNPANVGRLLIIYSNLVKEHQNYIYGIEKLTSLVGKLYKKGYNSDADAICDVLGRKGFNDFSYIYGIYHSR